MTTPPDSAPPPLRLLFWESTARCNLACAHCRRLSAEAPPDELSTDEARRLIDSAAAGPDRPIFVFSGGEPLLRSDWPSLAAHARQAGLHTALATNGTLVDDRLAREIADAGFHRVSVSLDGPDAETHDALRGQAGAFDKALAGLRALRRADVPLQINTTVSAANLGALDDMFSLACREGAEALHLFVLVPVGCGLEYAADQQLSADQCERVLGWVCDLQAAGHMQVKATCAPQYYRVAAEWLTAHGEGDGAAHVRAARRGRGCLAGVGVAFVSCAGEVFPCGYLPVSCGNVRRTDLRRIWAEAEVFARLRNFNLLTGKCGCCEYKAVCGGCRARAFAATGDWLTEEPACAHTPSSA